MWHVIGERFMGARKAREYCQKADQRLKMIVNADTVVAIAIFAIPIY